MRIWLGVILCLVGFLGTAVGQTPFARVDDFRATREKLFRSADTPLPPDARAGFKGLLYFVPDSSFVVPAKFEKSETGEVFLLPTSIGTTRKYTAVGLLRFTLNDVNLTLIAFRQAVAGDRRLFVPFRDASNGVETYRAGRYLDLEEPAADGTAVIDFNLAYNPNCAYGDESYSCTLPPKNNTLTVRVNAGEKAYVAVAKQN